MTKYPLIASLLLFYGHFAHSNETIHIVTEDWPPFNYVLANGEVGGISSEKVKKIFKQANLPYDISVHRWPKAYNMAKNGKNVLIYSILRSKQREKEFKWICPLTQPVTLFYFRLASRSDIHINTPDDLNRYTIGVTPAEFTHQFVAENVNQSKNRLSMSANNPDNIQRLLNGEVDLIIETVPSIKLRLQKLGKPYTAVLPLTEVRNDDVSPNCMAFGLKTPDKLVEKVRRSLLRINAGL